MEEETRPEWADNPEEIPKKTVGRNGNLLNVGGTYEGAGRPKGAKNRSTILKHYLGLKLKRRDPITGEEKTLPLDRFLELEMLAKALEERDLPTYKEIKDTVFGKNTDNVNLTGDIDLSNAIQLNIGFEKPTEQPSDGN